MADNIDPLALVFLDTEDLEALLLLEGSRARVPTFNNLEHLKYNKFDMDSLSEQECKSRFRFYKDDVFRLARSLALPDVMRASNGTKWGGVEGLCIMLRRLNYPKRYEDMVSEFGRHPSDIGIIFNEMIYNINGKWCHLLDSFEQTWLQENNLRIIAEAVQEKGCPLSNCYGFLDGTLIPNARPTYHQREFYNGKDKVHGLKYQSLTIANGMIGNLYGPVEGRRHDSTLLRESKVLTKIENFATADGSPLVIYADKAYPIQKNLITPFRGIGLSNVEKYFNSLMSSHRIAVEWNFGKISSNFAFVNYAPNMKVFLQPIALYYKVAALMSNCHACVYGNQVSKYFHIQPPQLEEYLQLRLHEE